MKNQDMPAMPCELRVTNAQRQAAAIGNTPIPNKAYGLTKLEHFAGLAMQGYVSRVPHGGSFLYATAAFESVTLAKALLEELEKQE